MRARQAATPLVLVAGFALATASALAVGAGGVLKPVYPAMALGVGWVLFRRYPAYYTGFILWLWFVSPFVRRVVDYQIGYDAQNYVLVAPVVTTALCLGSLLRHLPKLGRSGFVAFLPVVVSLLYAYPRGIYNIGLQAASYSLLLWLAPVAFGFHLAVDGDRYLAHQSAVRRTFLAAAFTLGVYGVWQYLDPLPWDRYWMQKAALVSIGQPFPQQVRVFSTLNSPAPFAMTMMVGLLMLLETRAATHLALGVPAYLAFLLSLVRTAWAGWLVGVAGYLVYLRHRGRARVLGVLVLVSGGIAILAAPQAERVIERRLRSFTNLAEDRSLEARQASSREVLDLILEEPWGRGLGATGPAKQLASSGQLTFDNGILNLVISLGWAGAALYGLGTVWIVAAILRRFEPTGDPLPRVARAVAFATLAALSSYNTVTGVSGVVFWGLLGLSVSGRRWYNIALLPTWQVMKSAALDVHGRPAA